AVARSTTGSHSLGESSANASPDAQKNPVLAGHKQITCKLPAKSGSRTHLAKEQAHDEKEARDADSDDGADEDALRVEPLQRITRMDAEHGGTQGIHAEEDDDRRPKGGGAKGRG